MEALGHATTHADPRRPGRGDSCLHGALANGKRLDCEDLRRGCKGMVHHDGWRGSYDYVSVDRSPDGRATHHVPMGTGIYLPDA